MRVWIQELQKKTEAGPVDRKRQLPQEAIKLAESLGELEEIEVNESFGAVVAVGRRHVFKIYDVAAQERHGEISKEKRILDILGARLGPASRRLVARPVQTVLTACGSRIEVQTRLPGVHPARFSKKLSRELARFLWDMHSIDGFDAIDEFDGKAVPTPLSHYIALRTEKFYRKLLENTLPVERNLIESARSYILDVPTRVWNEASLCLIHKDLYTQNVLTVDGKLAGVIDWDSAQTGPKEWDFTILRQRCPRVWDDIVAGYPADLDQTLLDACGIFQCLRFWKSFPGDKAFVAQQIDYIKRILE
jgi:Ser/Thr protein kinase RdoA (MazF antagonist)